QPHEEASSTDALKNMVGEAVVIADRLQAAVSEVDSSMSELETIADLAMKQEDDLRLNSQTAMTRLEEAFSALQEVSAASQQIRMATEEMSSESNETREIVIEVRQSLHHTDEVMNELAYNHGIMQERIDGLIDQASKIGEINALIQEIVAQ